MILKINKIDKLNTNLMKMNNKKIKKKYKLKMMN